MDFSYEINDADDIQIILFKGKLMANHLAEDLLSEIDGLVRNNHNQFILDLSELEYMNSSGLNTFIHILTKARNAGGEAIIAHLSDTVSKLLVTTKLTTVFKISKNTETALQEMKSLADEIND